MSYGDQLMEHLSPVKDITKHNYSGKLLIDGDLEDNCIMFRFLFDTAEMVHPLILWVRTIPIASLKIRSGKRRKQREKIFVYECNVQDFNNPVMKTELLYPEFILKKHEVRVIHVESQVSCCF